MNKSKKAAFWWYLVLILLAVNACTPKEPEIVRVFFANDSDIPVSALAFTPAEGELAEAKTVPYIVYPSGSLETNVRGAIYAEIAALRAGDRIITSLTDVQLISGHYNLILTGTDGVYSLTLSERPVEALPPPPTPDLDQ